MNLEDHIIRIEEKSLKPKSGREILKIFDKNENRVFYLKTLKKKEVNDELELKIFEKLNNNKNLVFEFDIIPSSLRLLPSRYDKNPKGSFIPLTLGKLIDWYFKNSDYLIKFNDNLRKLVVDLSYMSSYLSMMLKIDSNFFGEKEITNDLTILKSDANYMNIFYTTRELVEDNFRKFEQF